MNNLGKIFSLEIRSHTSVFLGTSVIPEFVHEYQYNSKQEWIIPLSSKTIYQTHGLNFTLADTKDEDLKLPTPRKKSCILISWAGTVNTRQSCQIWFYQHNYS